jgi:hypothetical protein
MNQKIFIAAGLLVSAVIGGVAFAQTSTASSAATAAAQSKAKKVNMSELRSQCSRDAMTHCRADIMSPDRIIVCLRRNRSVLSAGCAGAVDRTAGATAPSTPAPKSSAATTPSVTSQSKTNTPRN